VIEYSQVKELAKVIALTISVFFSSAALASRSIKIVYPNPQSEICAASTFFVGEIEPGHLLTCNQEKVRVNEFGFFAHVVKLKPGDNPFLFSLDNGKEQEEITIKREQPLAPISINEIKLRKFEPAQDLGVKSNDLISFSVRATPLSQVIVQIGSRRIALNESAGKVANHGRKLVRTRRQAHIVNGQDVAYGEVFQRSNPSPSDLYTGFYRVTPDDHWNGLKPKVSLTQKTKTSLLTPTTRIWTVEQPAIAQTTHTQTVTRLGPGLARTTPLDEGVRLEIDGWVGNQMRCRYGESLHVWIDKKDLAFETELTGRSTKPLESAAAPRAVARTINTKSDEYGQSIQIPLNQRLPYQVEQKLTPNSLILKLYGVTSDTDWVTNPSENEGTNSQDTPAQNPVDHVNWKQAADDIYEVTVHLTGKRQWGYKISYEGTTLNLDVKKPPTIGSGSQRLSGLKICLDPGHGGSETGSIGCSGKHESEINFAIAQKLEALLISQGALVTMTRTNDNEFHSLEDRVKQANDEKCDLLLSIHNNALPDGRDPWKEHGTSAYWYHPQSIELARCLKDSLVESLAFPDLGARYQNLALARPTAMPAVLVEVGFMINPDEYAKLIDPAFQEKIAQALCDGLEKYFRAEIK
jgi:N-acetylmuramoyl-L-alanine amidase